jgi:hypothetical protein
MDSLAKVNGSLLLSWRQNVFSPHKVSYSIHPEDLKQAYSSMYRFAFPKMFRIQAQKDYHKAIESNNEEEKQHYRGRHFLPTPNP